MDSIWADVRTGGCISVGISSNKCIERAVGTAKRRNLLLLLLRLLLLLLMSRNNWRMVGAIRITAVVGTVDDVVVMD